MHTLILMRHAKTEGSASGGDRARELTAAGARQAAEAGVALGELGVDAALVSTATRTRQTFAALGLGVTSTELDELYDGGSETAARLISATDESVGSLLVVGHAPTIPDLAATLLFATDPDQARDVASWFPTGSYATFTVTGPWSQAFDTGKSDYRGTTRPR